MREGRCISLIERLKQRSELKSTLLEFEPATSRCKSSSPTTMPLSNTGTVVA